jgi:hypothetical protein
MRVIVAVAVAVAVKGKSKKKIFFSKIEKTIERKIEQIVYKCIIYSNNPTNMEEETKMAKTRI